ncbi:superinfection exclusion protein B, partial [Escherichia coli]|uniref:superinfection exclusion protein B n=1 Tax=Escherichia coli TaxID=562 RepID=UPI001FCED0DF
VTTKRIGKSILEKTLTRWPVFVDHFNSLTLGERAYLAFAVAANNQLQTEKGAHESISLLKKGLLVRRPPAVGYPDTDRFVIPESYRHECYIRFAGKADSLMDELIAQDKHGKNK